MLESKIWKRWSHQSIFIPGVYRKFFPTKSNVRLSWKKEVLEPQFGFYAFETRQNVDCNDKFILWFIYLPIYLRIKYNHISNYIFYIFIFFILKQITFFSILLSILNKLPCILKWSNSIAVIVEHNTGLKSVTKTTLRSTGWGKFNKII